nr:MAG TPA: hypothetical protein [Caudoviricetes sp.]
MILCYSCAGSEPKLLRKTSAEKLAECANTRSAQPAPAATSCLSAKKSLKQFAATLALES